MNKVRNILVPGDFSKESKNALDSALSLLICTYPGISALPPFFRLLFVRNQRIEALKLGSHAAYPAR